MLSLFSRLRRNLVFVHIPKTGGTTARLALKPFEWRRQFIQDYGPDQSDTTEAFRAQLYDRAQLDRLGERLSRWRGTFVVGHFRARKYRGHFPPEDFATILREPFARLVSEYNHRLSLKGLAEGTTFRDFIRDPRFRNMMTRALDGTDIDRYGFLGLTETMDRDMARFGRFLGGAIDAKPANRGRYAPDVARIKEETELREEALQRNADDVALYDYVSKRLTGAPGTMPPVLAASRAGVHGLCRLLPRRLGVDGWIERARDGPPRTVRIAAGGRILAETAASAPRDDIYAASMTDHPECGFRVLLDWADIPDGVTELVVTELGTGLPLRNSPLDLARYKTPAEAPLALLKRRPVNGGGG